MAKINKILVFFCILFFPLVLYSAPEDSNNQTAIKTPVVRGKNDQNNNDNKVNAPNSSAAIDNTSSQSKQNDKAVDDENLNGYTGYSKPSGYVQDINVLRRKNGTISLIFRVDKPFLAEIKVLNFPFRLLIDIPMPYGWKVDDNELKSKIPITLISGFRYGNPVENVFRIVADLGRPVSIDRAYVRKVGSGYDFIIDLGSSNTGTSVLAYNTVVYANDSSVLKEVAQIAEQRDNETKIVRNKTKVDEQIKQYLSLVKYPSPEIPADRRKVLIVLDPGHGGKDPGAITTDSSLQEKNLVLGVASRLKASLEENKQISVVMTRVGDYYLPLRDRVLWTEYLGADLFVSLHADKSETGVSSSGMSLYTLSEVASDAQAQILANNSNRSDIVAGVPVTKEDEDVNRILSSLSQRARSNNSVRLASSIVSRAPKEIKILNNPIRSAGFAVLKSSSIPSVLIEMGFLSNPDDINNFKNVPYLDALVYTISSGIQSYLWDTKSIDIFPSILTQKSPPAATTKEVAASPEPQPSSGVSGLIKDILPTKKDKNDSSKSTNTPTNSVNNSNNKSS